MSEWRACLLTAQNQKRHISYPAGLFVPVSEVTWPTWTGRWQALTCIQRALPYHVRPIPPHSEAASSREQPRILPMHQPHHAHRSSCAFLTTYTRSPPSLDLSQELQPRQVPHDRLSSPLYTSTITLGPVAACEPRARPRKPLG